MLYSFAEFSEIASILYSLADAEESKPLLVTSLSTQIVPAFGASEKAVSTIRDDTLPAEVDTV